MITEYESLIVRTACKLLVPFVQLFAIYVLIHGHESPGGGFQSGAILGASVILLRFTQAPRLSSRFLPGQFAIQAGAFGVLIYLLAGLLPLIWGGNLLDYGAVPVPGMSKAEVRHLGILVIEIGVATGVAGVMISIFDDLAPQPGAE